MHVLLRADQRVKQNHEDVLLPAHPRKNTPIGERIWTDIEPLFAHRLCSVEETDQSSSSWSSTSRRFWGDWILENKTSSSESFWVYWSDEKWKSIMARGGENKTRFQYCTDAWGQILYLRGLQGHSGRNVIDPALQDNVLIPDDFFEYICHVGCAINLHSVIISGLTPGGQNLSRRQTVFFLWIPWTIRTLIRSTWMHHVLHGSCIQHGRNIRTLCIGTTKNLLKRKGLKFCQTRSNAIIFYNTLPASCIPKAVRMEIGEIIYEKLWITSTASEDFLEKWLDERNWVQKLFDKQKTTNQPNQTLIQL